MNIMTKIILASSITLFLLTVVSCGKQAEPITANQKMPITTRSPLAMTEYLQGKKYSDVVQRSMAAIHFRKAIKEDPGFALAWLGLVLVSGGTEESLNALDSAKHYATQVTQAEQHMIRAVDLGIKGDIEGQHRELDALIAAYPGDEDAHVLKGNMYFGLQDYQAAIQSYTTALTIQPRTAIAYNQLGYCERALGNYGKAEIAFKQYTALNPLNPNAFDSYAELLLEMGRYPESIEYYKQALALDPQFASSHIGIACDWGFLGQGDSARAQLAILKSKARSKGDRRRAIYAEALTYVCEGDLGQAIRIIDQNLTSSIQENDISNMANDLVAKGNLHLEAGEIDQALKCFDKSIQSINRSGLQPAIVANAQDHHLYNLARVYCAKGEMLRAWETAEVFAKEVEANKNPVQICLSHQLNGILALAEKKYDRAIKELQQADQMNPYNLYRIGQAYAGLGNTEMAEGMKLRAAELNVLNSMDQALVLKKTRYAPKG